MAMARDGMLPKSLVKTHPKYGTPHIITLCTGAVVCLLSGLLPVGKIAELANMGTLLAFFTVCIGVFVLRKTQPDAHRPFRCPAVGLVAPLGAFFCAIYSSAFGLLLAWWCISLTAGIILL